MLTLTKGLYRKHIGCNKDYANGTGIALKPPLQLSLRITNACNHRCAVCGQYGTHGYMKDSEKRKEMLKIVPLERYKKLIDEVAYYKPLFYITGGEPFLYPGFSELMKYIKEKGCIATVVTNGVGLEANAEEMVKNQWDMIMVSFDGTREIHDKCRGVAGAYDTAINGIKKLNEIKKKYKSVKPFVLTSTTLSLVNAPVLEETFKIGEEIKPDLMVIYLSWFTSENIGKEQTEIFEKELGVTPFTWKSYATTFKPEEAKIFQEALTRVKEKKWNFDYFVIPDLKGDNIAKYYLEPSAMFGYDKCVAPFFMVDVMPNGDIATCRDFIDVKVGNIMEKPLLEIWNGEGFVKFRKSLIKHKGLFPQCSRCCGLMGF